MTAEHGEVVAQAAMDAIAVVQERHPNARLVEVRVTLIVDTPTGRCRVCKVTEWSADSR